MLVQTQFCEFGFVYAHLQFFLSFKQFPLNLVPRHVDQISLQQCTTDNRFNNVPVLSQNQKL